MDNQERQSPGGGNVATIDANLLPSTFSSRLSPVDSSSPDFALAPQDERAALASSQTSLNISAPASRLPHDVLVTVFSHLVAEELEDHVPVMDNIPCSVPWVRLAYVCRPWRHAALNSPTLWRYLVLPLPARWAHTMLTRAQHAPLFISYYHGDVKNVATTWQPVATLEQVQGIDINHYKGNQANLVQLLSTPAPILEYARINVPSLAPGILPAPLFADHAPRLRDLAVSNTHISSWTSSFIHNLAFLQVGYHLGSLPSVSEFVAVLQQLSRIEVLVLSRGGMNPFSSTTQPSDASQIARLPLLRNLNICGSASQCVGFLRHVQPSDSVALCVDCYEYSGLQEFTALYPFLAPARGFVADRFPFVEMELVYDLHLKLTARRVPAPDDHSPADRDFSLGWRWKEPRDEVVDILRGVCRAMGVHCWLSLAVDLDLDWYPKIPPMALADVFGGAVELRTLRATGTTALALSRVLPASMDGGAWRHSSEAGGTVLWPKLDYFELRDLDFHEDVLEGEEGYDKSVGEVLLCELGRRKQRGVPLGTLALVNCEARRQWLQEAGRLVGSVSLTRSRQRD